MEGIYRGNYNYYGSRVPGTYESKSKVSCERKSKNKTTISNHYHSPAQHQSIPTNMKLILAGSTGFIGAEVLRQCLANPSITSLATLSRRELPSTFVDPDHKLKTVLVNDFEKYEAAVIKECEGAAGCIWHVQAIYCPNAFRRIAIPTPYIETNRANAGHSAPRHSILKFRKRSR
jgi:hypothetical protein